jgi:hypothetical protein
MQALSSPSFVSAFPQSLTPDFLRRSMTLQVLNSVPYTFLPSGILIVEPHEGLLTARSMLLAAADYYVGVSACSGNQSERNEEREVSIAILSESLGRAVLNGTAEIVRRNWPRARILIFGSSGAAIEDHLYDARIDHRARPEELLAALLMLTEYPRNQKATPAAILADGRVERLFTGGAIGRVAESDPTKRLSGKAETAYSRNLPGAEQPFRRAS